MEHATSLQVCMDTTNWLQGAMSEEISTGLNSSLSSPSGGATSECMLAAACSSRAGPPLMERRLRPPHDLHLKCPRCDSTHTKFCYYNNYSLSQPRYFCKTCRRYWTKGGTLRNIPVGGGCRKSSKKSTSKKPNNNDHQLHQSIISQGGSASSNPNNDSIHLSFPQVQFPPHLANLIGAQMNLGGGNFVDNGAFLRPIDFMENKYEGLIGGYNFNRGNDFMGGNHNGAHEFGVIGGIENNNLCDNNGGYKLGCLSPTTVPNVGGYNGLTSTFGGINLSSSNTNIFDGNLGISYMDQRMLLPYDGNNNTHQNGSVDIKPNPKLLSLEWEDHGCNNNSNVGNDTLNSWSGTMGGFQSSTTNSLV